jgi:hypothetical protein
MFSKKKIYKSKKIINMAQNMTQNMTQNMAQNMAPTINDNILNINNLFNFVDDTIDGKNVLYYIGEKYGNSSLLLAINLNNNLIYKYSNEWLYLIDVYYHKSKDYYKELVKLYHHINKNKQKLLIFDYDIISFITPFSLGTVHGYTGFFNAIIYYINNIDKFKDHKIAIYKKSQKGMIDMINHLVNKNIIDFNKIIMLDDNICYCFKSVYFIENKYHVFDKDLPDIVSTQFIDKYIKPDRENEVYMKSLELPHNLDRLLIIKGVNSVNLTGDGIFLNKDIEHFKNKMKLTLIEPGIIDEIKLIHIIQSCSIFVVSWGTSFFKNFIYISDKCKKIIVLILQNSNFYNQYLDHKPHLSTMYKNAQIEYIVTDSSLNNILF